MQKRGKRRLIHSQHNAAIAELWELCASHHTCSFCRCSMFGQPTVRLKGRMSNVLLRGVDQPKSQKHVSAARVHTLAMNCCSLLRNGFYLSGDIPAGIPSEAGLCGLGSDFARAGGYRSKIDCCWASICCMCWKSTACALHVSSRGCLISNSQISQWPTCESKCNGQFTPARDENLRLILLATVSSRLTLCCTCWRYCRNFLHPKYAGPEAKKSLPPIVVHWGDFGFLQQRRRRGCRIARP